jgi:hypothetical protein
LTIDVFDAAALRAVTGAISTTFHIISERHGECM